jgi:hypothetical protein
LQVESINTRAEAVMFLLQFYAQHSRNYKAVDAIRSIIN